MSNDTIIDYSQIGKFEDVLTGILHDSAQQLLCKAVEAELGEFLKLYEDRRTGQNLRLVVRSGHHPECLIQTGIGPVPVRIPKVRSSDGKPVTFRSSVVPPHVRKSRTLEAWVPWLYLKGISTGEMAGVLSGLLTIADGAMGFRSVLDRVFPEARHQRCRVHKTANVLAAMPKAIQPGVKSALRQIRMAETRDQAGRAFDGFLARYQDQYPKAAVKLIQDREERMNFLDFPAEHWQSIRTTNPIESTFATIRHRTRTPRGCLSHDTMLAMMFKLGQCAESRWQRLRGFRRLGQVIEGVRFQDGIEVQSDEKTAAAG